MMAAVDCTESKCFQIHLSQSPELSLGLCSSFWSVHDPSCECSLFAKVHIEEFSSTQRVKWIIFILDHFNDFHKQTAAHMIAAVDCPEGEC